MLEIIVATILTLLSYVVSQIVSISNAALEALVNSIPVIIPTVFMWARVPKNYLKFMSFKSLNIEYQIDIRIQNCSLKESHYLEIRNNLIKLDQSDKGEILKENIGEEVMVSSLNVNTAVVDLQYHISEKTLFIKSRSKIKYKLFFELAKDFLNEINSTFTSNESICYNKNDLQARLRIEFIDENKGNSKIDTSNPFWNKLFDGFKSKIVDFSYITKNNNSVLISNNLIEFMGNNLESLSLDINKELTFLGFRN